MRFTSCFIFLFLFNWQLLCQQITFEHFTAKQGLSQSTVNCLLQDRLGFLWVGTDNGLNRFDGYHFLHFFNDQNDPASLGNNSVNDLLEDREGFIWAATRNGLSRYDPTTGSFRVFRHDPADRATLAFPQVHSLFEDGAGNLWAGASSSLEKFDRKTGTFSHFPIPVSIPFTPGELFIHRIIEFENQLYLGTWGQGLLRFDRQKGSFERIFTERDNLNGNNWIDDLLPDGEGSFVAVVNGNVTQFDPAADLLRVRFWFKPMNFDRTVIALHRTGQGHWWVGLSGRGLCRLDRDFRLTGQFFPDPDTSNQYNNFITVIFEAADGEIWLGTRGNGLFKFDPQRKKFKAFSQGKNSRGNFNLQDANGLLETSDGEIWVASRSNGIHIIDKNNREISHLRQRADLPEGLKGKEMTCLFEDKKGRIWVGCWGDGLKMFDPETDTYRHFLTDDEAGQDPDDNFISSLCEAKNNRLWVTTPGGVLVLDIASQAPFVLKKYKPRQGDAASLSHHVANVAFCDRRGDVWVGTTNGLNRFDARTDGFQCFLHDPADTKTLGSNQVTTIFEDRQNHLWVGCWGGGLNRYDPENERFTHLSQKDGLPNNSVQGIVEDGSGRLWLTTERGLSRFDPRGFGAGSATGVFSNYFSQDGLPGDRFLPKSLAVLQHTGEIIAGGVEGFLRFHPDSIIASSFQPPVAIVSLHKYVTDGKGSRILEVKGISALRHIELPFSENTLAFEFAAFNFRQAAQNQYAYKLEGLATEWAYIGNKREVTFSNLPPGSYTLRVKASNNDGVWNEEGVSLKITIRPPWYRSWWAYLAYFLAAGGLFYFIRKRELQAHRLRHRLELEQVAAEKLKEVDQLKNRLYTNITHEFRTPLTVISGMAEQSAVSSEQLAAQANEQQIRHHKSEIRHNTALIQRNSQSLLRLVNQLLDLAKLETGNLHLELRQSDVVPFVQYVTESFQSYAAGKNIRLVFQPQVGELVMDFDENKLQSILSNLLSNAVKFTGEGGVITLRLREESDGAGSLMVVEVEDTGIGIPEDQLPRIFDRFYQADNPTSGGRGVSPVRAGEGSGIGLTLVRELVELMKGSIGVKSQAGQGSVFTLRLPVQRKAAPPDPLKGESKGQPPAKILGEIGSELSGFGSPFMGSGGESDDHPLLLIIEDNADVVTYIRSCLKSEYQILVAENGSLGIERALETIPDIILSDVMMPEKDGYEVCHFLKNDERTSHIPVVLLTAKADLASRIEGLQRGADAYLAKPFDKKELLVVLEKLVELRRRLQEKYGSFQLAVRSLQSSVGSPQSDEGETSTSLIPHSSSLVPDLEDAFLQKINLLLEAHFADAEFDVAQLCRAAGMSQPQLYRKLKALTGQTIVAWMRRFRLEKARELLLSSELNVSEVAYRTGFNDPAYFSRAFSEEFGEAPVGIKDRKNG